MDETIITETPPLRSSWAQLGQQAEVAITGNRLKRVVYGVLNIASGHLETLITERWTAYDFQAFLGQIRKAWRGWNIVLFLDRGSPHTAGNSRELSKELGIELRWLPTATPELNPLESQHLYW